MTLGSWERLHFKGRTEIIESRLRFEILIIFMDDAGLRPLDLD